MGYCGRQPVENSVLYKNALSHQNCHSICEGPCDHNMVTLRVCCMREFVAQAHQTIKQMLSMSL